MANITLTIEAHKLKALESEFSDVTAFFQNFVEHRYMLREKEILNKLIEHCNENDVTIATGVSAQIDQAYTLKIISKATEDVPKFPE
tara:strand:+ start:264 stop:524 length:261 start_codon:yes stop_codon:yes gene_type:complete